MNSYRVGVFDTGKGGLIVANRLQSRFPGLVFQLADDQKHAPYGTKSDAEVRRLSAEAIRPLIDQDCRTIIVACNTATTIAITHLRTVYPQIHFIGFEPMIKPAAKATKTGTIMVLATPATLSSQRYQKLKHDFASNIVVIEPDCHDWAPLIQANRKLSIDLEPAFTAAIDRNCDQVVIACTHFLAIESLLLQLFSDTAKILEPTNAIASRLQALLQA